MPRPVVPLTDSKCEAAKPRDREYKLFDGGGLYLLVKPTGVKSWRFKYRRPDGRERLATFGAYPALTLKAARKLRDEARAQLAEGVDPAEQKRAKQHIAGDTFEQVAKAWLTKMSAKWSADHAKAVWRRIELHLLPALGQRPIGALKPRDLLPALKAVEAADALHLAARLRQYISAIFQHAVQHGLAETNPARDLVGATATGKTAHRAALPLERLPELLRAIEADGTGRPLTRFALKLTLLTFVRSSELRFARWSEFDIDRALWTIPAEREAIEGVKHSHRGAKMKEPHLVPLSPQALAVLRDVHQFTKPFDLVFAGDHDPRKPMSENTINTALRRLGFSSSEVSGHGFRAMACSALVESGLFSRDVIERQMSHMERNGVRAAYVHLAEHVEERKRLMEWWADYLAALIEADRYITPREFATRPRGSNVIPLPARRS